MTYPNPSTSLASYPGSSQLFNVAREKRGSLVKLITCVMSGGTNLRNSIGLKYGLERRLLQVLRLER